MDTTILVSALTSLIVSGIALFLYAAVTGSVKAHFDKQLESYKSELRSQSDTDLERERARLRVLTESFLSRASHLAETRLERLVKLYELIVVLEPALERYVNPVKDISLDRRGRDRKGERGSTADCDKGVCQLL
jgi:hypothetical protein